VVPALYGFIPQTFCGERVGKFCSDKTGRPGIVGDGDPIDICVLTEKTLSHGDLLVNARPIGGFRMIDGKQADDKIIAVLRNDTVYGHFKDISEVPPVVIKRLEHYFLTYKDMPGEDRDSEIAATYGVQEAYEVIQKSIEDYNHKFENLGKLLP
jgi:inorganic pyrophosphatase